MLKIRLNLRKFLASLLSWRVNLKPKRQHILPLLIASQGAVLLTDLPVLSQTTGNSVIPGLGMCAQSYAMSAFPQAGQILGQIFVFMRIIYMATVIATTTMGVSGYNRGEMTMVEAVRPPLLAILTVLIIDAITYFVAGGTCTGSTF